MSVETQTRTNSSAKTDNPPTIRMTEKTTDRQDQLVDAAYNRIKAALERAINP